jgi:hypothetical protein
MDEMEREAIKIVTDFLRVYYPTLVEVSIDFDSDGIEEDEHQKYLGFDRIMFTTEGSSPRICDSVSDENTFPVEVLGMVYIKEDSEFSLDLLLLTE